ncbi:MAG: hypothetical protein RLZZ148_934 [Cyanobacteriota bacterium]|jgi:hypothetical protein
MKSWLIAPLSTLAVALVPSVADALTFTTSPSVSFISPITTNLSPRVSTPPIPKFDPADAFADFLAQNPTPVPPPGNVFTGVSLVGVNVEYEATLDLTPFQFRNQGSDPGVGTLVSETRAGVETINNVRFDAPGSGLDVSYGELGFTPISISSGTLAPDGLTSFIDEPIQTRRLSRSIPVGSADLSNFIVSPGSDSYSFDVWTAIQNFTDSTNFNVVTVPPPNLFFGFTATVSYEYEPNFGPFGPDVPEPSSLLGLGLFGLGLGSTVLRKKKKA